MADRALDRLSATQHPEQRRDRVSQEALERACPGLVNTFRALHPTRLLFTYHHSLRHSRIDRGYVTPALQPWVARATVGAERGGSDHSSVTVVLAARKADDVGPGVRRARMDFATDTALAEEFKQWLQQQVAPGRPSDPVALLGWWQQVKRRLTVKMAELNRRRRAAMQASRNGARRAAAVQRVLAAHAALDAAVSAHGAPSRQYAEASAALQAAHADLAVAQRSEAALHELGPRGSGSTKASAPASR